MTVLCYHSVQPDWTSPLAVAPADFARQCAWLSQHRQVLPLREAVERLDRSYRLPRGLATLTFDDGFLGLFEHAMPAVRRHQLPITVFLVAQTLTTAGQVVDWVDTAPEYELKTLSRDEIWEMQAAGVDFQSHSFSHADLTQLSFDDCVKDLSESRELLESVLSRPVTLLAYPRGRHNAQVRAAAVRAGYTHAFSLPETREEPGPLAIPRVGIYHGNGLGNVRVKSSRSYLPLRLGPAYRIGQRLRSVAAGRKSW